jgi:protein-tyrosine phosphatase
MSDLLGFAKSRVATGGAVTSAEHVRELLAAGITHVIDCWGEEDHTGLFSGTSIIAMRPPPTLDDGAPKAASWFEPSIAFALRALALPHTRVLAHCAGGVNRGPSTAYAILRAQGFTAADAELSIRICRPIVQLLYMPDADAAVVCLGYT